MVATLSPFCLLILFDNSKIFYHVWPIRKIWHEGQPVFDRLEELRKTIEKENFEFEGVKIQITIAIGVSEYVDGIKLGAWVELADKRCTQAKITERIKRLSKSFN